jgi:peptide/nickel transport system permease protein/oligopeptide transport system permease protein
VEPVLSALKYFFYRLLTLAITLVGLVTLIFILIRSIPGDPARVLAGMMASEEDVNLIREQLGLNQPIYIQYFIYLKNLFTFNLGVSFRTDSPVINEIMARLPNTLLLAVTSTCLAVILGVPLGVIAASRKGGKLDLLLSTFSIAGISLPIYWLGLILILIFSVGLRLLPAGGSGTPLHLILPTVTIALYLMAFIVKITKASVIDSMEKNYVITAKSKGLSERTILYRHVLKNALIPVVTIVGLQFGALLGGAVITETIFAWPGLGRLIVDSINSRDYPMVQGSIFIFALLYALVNLATDILYTLIDPRVRLK